MDKTRLISGLLLLMVIAAASAAFAADAKNQAGLTRVVVAEATRSEGWLPVYLAKELGFFREEGLDPELVTYKDGPLALMGLLELKMPSSASSGLNPCSWPLKKASPAR